MRAQPGHEGRNDLAGEHPFGDTGQLILLIVFVAVWILDSFVFRASVFPARFVPLFLRIVVGVSLLGAAWYFASKGMRVVFGEKRNVPAVIESGVFSRVRHPIYLGCILFYIGCVVFTLSVFSILVLIAIVIFYHYIARHEELLLRAKFGTAYERYAREVPMLLPRIRSAGGVKSDTDDEVME